MIKSLLFIITSAYLFHSLNSYAQEKINMCNSSDVVVAYTKIEDYQLVCESLNDVTEVAKKIGLSNAELKITISIVDKLNINTMGKSLATFNPNTMKIQVLSMKACKKALGSVVVLGQEIDKELYKSIIIHELAHALFWTNQGNIITAREIHEYFAYTIQLALLDEFHRDNIILSSDVPAFSNRSEISEEYYLLSPTRFAVKSYLHFINTQEDWPYLRSLFNL